MACSGLMYEGVPRAEPSSVSTELAPEEGSTGGLAMRGLGTGLPHRLREPPIDDQGLTVIADDDVRRLQVAVQHAAAVGVVDGIANVDEPAQQPL